MANRFLNNIRINDEYTLPSADGSADQVITTDGAGNLSFTDVNSVIDTATEEVYFTCKNSTGSTIAKGKGVMAVGTDGNSGHILMDEMVADGTIEPRYFLGILAESVGNGNTGKVIHFGEIDQFNTNGQNGETWNDGQILWCDPDNPGDYTITEPDGPNVKIAAAIILKASTNGKIRVRVQGNEGIHDLHDTKITSQVDGDVLVWDNTTGVWFNDSTLNVDYANGRVGIGTTSPLTSLHVANQGSAAQLSLERADTSDTLKLVIGSSYGYLQNTTGPLSLGTSGGNQQINIATDGDVGIGTTSPQSKLHIETGSGGTYNPNVNHDDVTIEGSGNIGLQLFSPATTYQYIAFGDPDSVNAGYIRYYHGTNQMVFRTNGGDNMIINSTGNVGIGTTSPASTLDINGITTSKGFQTNTTNTNYNLISRNSAGNATLYVQSATSNTNQAIAHFNYGSATANAGTQVLKVAKDNSYFINTNLGIGTTSPERLLSLYSNNTETTPRFLIEQDGTGDAVMAFSLSGGQGWSMGIDNSLSDSFMIHNSAGGIDSSSQFTINTSGSVGIGTTNPGAINGVGFSSVGLHVKAGTLGRTITEGSDWAEYILNDSGANVNQRAKFIKANNGTLSLGSYDDNGTPRTQISILNGGNVGIGTASPSYKLDISGAARVNSKLLLDSADYAQHLSLRRGVYGMDFILTGNRLDLSPTASTTELKVLAKIRTTSDLLVDGNVGIGTTSPSAKLHVYNAGNSFIKIDSDATSPYMAGVEFLRSSVNGGRIYNDGGAVQVKLESYFGYDSANPTRGGFMFKTAPVTSGTLVDAVRIDARGYVGIGATSPETKLDISDSNPFITIQGNNASYVNGGIQFISNHASTARGLGNFYYSAHSDVEWFSGIPYNNNDAFVINRNTGYTVPSSQSSPPGIGASAGTKFIVNSSGNVGIGTTSPSNKLDVIGNLSATNIRVGSLASGEGIIRYNGGSGNGIGIVTGTLDSSGIGLFVDHSTNNRNVGIGTTIPSQKLTVEGNIELGTGGYIYGDTTTSYLRLNNAVGSLLGYSNAYIGLGPSFVYNVGGSEKFRIQSSNGNVGIGTTSPSTKLSLADNSSGAILSFKRNNTTTTGAKGGLTWIDSSNYYVAGISALGDGTTDNSGELVFRTSTGEADNTDLGYQLPERMRIDSSGNVGIGTTSPSQKLHVSGNARVTGAYYDSNNSAGTSGQVLSSTATGTDWVSLSEISGVDGSGTSNYLTYWADSDTIAASKILQNSTGYKIEGNSGANYTRLQLIAPATKTLTLFEITNGSDANNASATIYGRGDGSYPTINAISRGTGVTQAINFGIDSSEKMRIHTNGNVGIGTTSPTAPFHVDLSDVEVKFQLNNSGAGFDGILVDGTNASYNLKGGNGDEYGLIALNDGSFRIYNPGGSGYGFTMTNIGRFGLSNTAPTQKLDVNGNIKLSNGSQLMWRNAANNADIPIVQLTSSNQLNIGTASSSVPAVVAVHTSSAERMRIDSSGNVGIGTASPSSKLEVDGSIKFPNASYIVTKDSAGNSPRILGINSSNTTYIGPIDSYVGGSILYGVSSGVSNQMFYTLAQERMRITNLGRVGIGTTSPVSTLDVKGSATIGNSGGVLQGDSPKLRLRNMTALPGGYVESDTFNFRFDESATAYAGEATAIGGTINQTTGTTIPEQNLKNLFTYTASYINLYSYRDASNNVVIELDNISVSNSANTSWKPYVFFHASSGNVTTMTIEVKNGSGTWETVENNIDCEDFYIYDGFYITSAGVLKGARFTFTNIVGNSYLRMIGVIGKTHPSYQWNILKSGGNMYGNLSFADEKKLLLGNSTDLQLYHDGSNSYIDDTGTGNLKIRSNRLQIEKYTGETMAEFVSDGETSLWYDNNKKLATTSAGIDVTGIAQMDTGITEGIHYVGTGVEHWGDGGTGMSFPANDTLSLKTASSDRLYINSTGNVGIGTTSPAQNFVVADATNGNGVELVPGATATIQTYNRGTSSYNNLNIDTARTQVRSIDHTSFHNGSGYPEHMRITSAGNVGIGTTSPAVPLHVDGFARLNGGLQLNTANAQIYQIQNSDLRFGTNNTERIRITSAGNVGIGTTSPSYKLHAVGGISAGGKVTYSKSYGSLDTTGAAVAGLDSSSNGASAMFTFTCFGHTAGYQKIVYSCYNAGGTWNTKKVIDEGTNDFDVEASANSTTITFTFKSTSGTKSYTPRVTVEAAGTAINSTYA